MLCTSSSSNRDLCSITRESANEFCWVFFQDILGILWLFSKTGASAYPPIMMFKVLILQAWYALSDEALEKQIARV
jgi:apolipoprotein N-acyltransferase